MKHKSKMEKEAEEKTALRRRILDISYGACEGVQDVYCDDNHWACVIGCIENVGALLGAIIGTWRDAPLKYSPPTTIKCSECGKQTPLPTQSAIEQLLGHSWNLKELGDLDGFVNWLYDYGVRA